MPDPTENTVNTLIAQYLSSQQIPVLPFGSDIKVGFGTPDFVVKGALTLYGEGEWNSNYAYGLLQAANYGEAPQADGYFLLGYPDQLKNKISKAWREAPGDLLPLLRDVSYRGVLKVPGEPARPWRGKLEQIPQWLRDGISRKPQPPDPDEFLQSVQDLVEDLAGTLPLEGQWPQLFEHADISIPATSGSSDYQRRAAAYLLLDQIVFYRILQERGYPELKPAAIDKPLDLKRNYFSQVTRDNYHAIYDLDVLSQFPESAGGEVRKLVKVVNFLQPEQFTRDLLGNIFHKLIPEPVRKPIAAFYTNVAAARLLARLTISDPSSKVADLACGSGTLLMAAYDRKAELHGGVVGPEVHKQFVEKDLTGIDIMSFAAHLAVVQLALRNPSQFTDTARIAVENSTRLGPGSYIPPLEETVVGRRNLDHWSSEAPAVRTVRRGAVSSEGQGKGFDMDSVDVVLMNPPFSRKQDIPTEKRERLNENLEEYKSYIDNGMNLGPYFVLLADRFLRDSGRIGMVLPDSILDQESAAGVREFLVGRYALEYIILAGHKLAFSEEAKFLEILLIARKSVVSDKNHSVITAYLGAKPSEENNEQIARILEDLARAGRLSGDLSTAAAQLGMELALVPQSVFASSKNWIEAIPQSRVKGFLLPSSAFLTPLKNVVNKVTQGLRFARMEGIWIPDSTYLSVPRAANVRSRWVVTAETPTHVDAVSRSSGLAVHVPKGVLRATTRSAAGLPTLEITRAWDYTVVDRFPGDELFWDTSDADTMVQRRKEKYAEKESHLIIAGRNNVNLRSKNTHFLAFVSPELTSPPWQFWCVQTHSLEDAKLLALWWNSTLHIAQLFLSRGRGMASYGGWEKSDLEDLLVLDPSKLSAGVSERLREVYDKWARTPFPCIREQLASRFEGRVDIDEAICEALGTTSSQAGFPALYQTLSDKIARIGKQESSK